MKWLNSLFGGKRTGGESYASRRVTSAHPVVIQNPRIAFLNLIGTRARLLIDGDAAVLKPLFSECAESDGAAPVCDVLMIYAKIEASGALQNTSDNLREIIHKSHAPITVVATEKRRPVVHCGGQASRVGQSESRYDVEA